MTEQERRAAFERTAREVVEPVRRYLARRADPDTAADVLSETLTVLWRRIEDTPADSVPWAIGVAKWQLANAQRSRRRADRLTLRILSTDEPGRTVPDHADRATDTVVIERALGLLSPAEAELLRLWAWDDLTPARIATILGVTPNAVSLRLLRARTNLGKILRKNGVAGGHELEERGGRS